MNAPSMSRARAYGVVKMHTNPMPDSAGTFDEWRTVKNFHCRKCKGHSGSVRLWESSCGGYDDYKYRCDDCGHTWWVEGDDG